VDFMNTGTGAHAAIQPFVRVCLEIRAKASSL